MDGSPVSGEALAGLAAEPEAMGRGLGQRSGLLGEREHVLAVARREEPLPRLGEGQRAGVELAQQAQRVDLQRGRLGVSLEAVDGHVVAAG